MHSPAFLTRHAQLAQQVRATPGRGVACYALFYESSANYGRSSLPTRYSAEELVGTAWVLIEAKRKRLVRRVKPLIEDLKQGGYRLSDELVEQILIRCRESP